MTEGRTSNSWLRLAVPLLAAALLAACDIGPDMKQPVVAEPPAWRESAAQSAAWPSADWWQGFGSAELDGLIAEAQQANYDLGAAVARIREADAQARVAGAALLPTVDAGGSVSRQRELFPLGPQGQTITYNEYQVGLTASYEIDFWGKNRAALNAAKATALASRYDQQVVALTVVTAVATSYFQFIGLEDRLKVARENLATAEDVLRVIEGRRQVGTAMDLDVSQQQTVVASLRAAIPPLEQQLSQTLDAVAILVGRAPEQVTIAEASLYDLSLPAVAPGLPSELLARRPDIAEAEAQLVSANANIKVARAQFYPSVDLTASGGFASLALRSLFTGPGAVWSVAGSFTQPIFEGGRLKGQLEFTKARYDELVQNYRKAVLYAFGNVEDALAAIRRTGEQQAAQEQTVAEARRSLEIARSRYQIGLTDLLTVLNTENALFPAEDTLVQVRLAHMQALVSLFNALGGGWQAPTGSGFSAAAAREKS
ncbi:MAG TPA: efflux transporter outer membrane subunit [Alphaproteobacteria bacterium]